MLIGQIQLLGDEAKKISIIAPDEFIILGRGSGADFIIKDSAVSKKHCKVFYQNGSYHVQDLDSRNCTYVNEQKVMDTAMLQNGDVIRVGRAKLQFFLVKHKEKTANLVVDFISSNKQEITFRPKEVGKSIEEDLLSHIVISLPHSTISRKQIQECFQLKQQCPHLTIKDILLQEKLLQEKDVAIVEATLNNILTHEKAKAPSQDEIESERTSEQKNRTTNQQQHLFIRLAQSKGFIGQQQVHAVQLLQKQYHRKGVFFTLPEILKKEGYLSPKQVQDIQESLGDKIPYHIEGYELLSLIGLGGMGSIYRARQISMDRIVAIKILSEEYRTNSFLNDLFLKEARAVAKLNHKNIIAGYDFGEAQGISYFVMEHVDGPSLQHKIQQCGGRLPINESIDITLQVAHALEHAWEKGLIHRDIKPDNILLTAKGLVKLCDLGLAQTTDQASPKRKKDFGTPAYMSPEQIRCESDIDIRSDVYSLGGVLYRMVFGRLPFSGTTREIMAKHLSEKLKFPSEGMNKNKMELAKIINKMMAKNRKERIQVPSELIDALTDVQQRLTQMDMANTMEVKITQPRVKLHPRRSLSFKKVRPNRRKRK